MWLKHISISTRLIVLLIFAVLLPLLIFGALAEWQVREATEISVTEGNARVAKRAAEQIQQYVSSALTLLKSTAENINNADLADWQKERILKNYRNQFDQFNELTIWDLQKKALATSRLVAAQLNQREQKAYTAALSGKMYLSPEYIREDLSPAMVVAVPLKRLTEVNGILIAELNLMHMWYLVDSIRIGKKGVLHIVDEDGRLLATGDGERKKSVFQGGHFEAMALMPKILEPHGTRFTNFLNTEVLSVGTRLKDPLHWSVIVEQPTREAYALATRIGYYLAAITLLFLVVALGLGFYSGKRRIIDPIRVLSAATEELARGNLDYRVELDTGDEFEQLGQAFNDMAARLKNVQEKLIQEEKHAMFGRIASGLAHDLKHPIQAIETSSRLIDKKYDDPEFRSMFQRTVNREFKKINNFLNNLHNLTHDIPFRPVPIKVNSLLVETLETFEATANERDIAIDRHWEDNGLRIEADPATLNRALSNLVSNAIEAIGTHGTLTIRAEKVDDHVNVTVQDSGKGIAAERLKSLFDDFVTTKRRGLGLGLAITKKIIAQHQGQLSVSSTVGVGTRFVIHIPTLPTSET